MNKANIRAKLLDQKPEARDVVIDGDTYKILPPTLKQQSDIQKANIALDKTGAPSIADMSGLIASVLVALVYVEEDGKLVPLFSELDKQSIMSAPATGLIAQLSAEALQSFNK